MRGTVYGCLRGSRRARALGVTGTCQRAARVDAVAVGGPFLAAGLTRCGVDTGSSTVTVMRFPGGRPVFSHAAVPAPGPESFSTVTAIVVSSGGAVAWIASSRSIVGHRSVVQVVAGDRRGTRVLDSGARIALGSLRLSGATVRWRDAGAERTARLS